VTVALTKETWEALPAHLGPLQAARLFGVDAAAWRWGVASGILPGADVERGGERCRWSKQRITTAAAAMSYLTGNSDYGIGAVKAADRIGFRLRRKVTANDVEDLVDFGPLKVADHWKGHGLYDRADLDAITWRQVRSARAAAAAWTKASISARAVRDLLGWSEPKLLERLRETQIEAGPRGRYRRKDIAGLTRDRDLAAAIRTGDTLGPEQAAAHLEVRRVDVDALVDAGLLAPVGHATKPVGYSSMVRVPLYRAAHLNQLKDAPGIDWEAVRATPAGKPSPLRALAPRRKARADAVKAFAAAMPDRWPGITVNLFYWAGRQQWALAWTRRGDGTPTIAEVDAAIAAAPELTAHQGSLFTDSWHNTAIGQATAWSQPGRAVIVDTETTTLYGRIVQIAVIDAATGATLLDTLVNPRAPIHPEAEAIHGISNAAVADAPTWDQVLPDFEAAVAGRQILAYNAEFDRTVIVGHTEDTGREPGPWADNARWGCLMEARSDWEGMTRWMRLDGGHTALADCLAARAVLEQMTGLYSVTYPETGS
jgi:hypothetical protein